MIALRLPRVSLANSIAILCVALVAVACAYAITPKLSPINTAPKLEEVIPHAFGDWVEIKSPLVQVSLSAGNETNINQPYDQTLMRAYRNSAGQIVYLALAWGANQRQEVKIHRPDLCYVAQGFRIKSLQTVRFDGIRDPRGEAIVGKRMYAENLQGGEVVSYWMRVGQLYSEDAWETRSYIFREGLRGQVPDGILVRASSHVASASEANKVWPNLENFLKDLASASPDVASGLLIR